MSLERFAEADAAIARGQRDEGLRMIADQLTQDPNAPVQAYRNFSAMLIRIKRYAEAAKWARQGTELYPRDANLWNNLGVSLRRLARYEEALAALRTCQKLDPKSTAALINIGNVYNDTKDARRSVELWTKLVRGAPTNHEFQRSLARGYLYSGDLDKAEMRFRLAIKLRPDYEDAWLDLINLNAEKNDPLSAIPLLDQALAGAPKMVKLCEAKAMLYRRANKHRDAEAYLLSLLPIYGDVAWLHNMIGTTISEWDRERAHVHMQKAIDLDGSNSAYRMALAESLSRTRGPKEAAYLEQAYGVLKAAEGMLELTPSELKVAAEIYTRLADYDETDKLGTFKEIGRKFVENGKHTALLLHLSRVKTAEDRRELVEQHRIWGNLASKAAAKNPLVYPAPRAKNGKIRVGYMSSDLRGHPVAYFAMPLFQHYDRSKFEVYCYSYYTGEEDNLQKQITSLVDEFRWRQEITDRDAAQMIADDNLDILLELGATTHMNKLGVMSYKPAPVSASWVGYPHSAGPSEITHLVVDPYILPEDPALLIEKPMLLPKAWYALGEYSFREEPAVAQEAPFKRNGFVTFGTANNPYKYSSELVRTWAKILAKVPNSQFLFVRPEGGSPTFCANIRRWFELEGVDGSRVKFEPIRGQHLPFYGQMDISLDTFPQTGGTTTCESMWMGVPVITLVGETMFERLSYSVLANTNLLENCAFTVDEYIEKAVNLAQSPDRIEFLRANLRPMLKQSPLGDPRQFAVDFYEAIRLAVTEAGIEV